VNPEPFQLQLHHLQELAVKPYPSVSGNTKCCSREGRFVLEQI
jgi:hypothetical protein